MNIRAFLDSVFGRFANVRDEGTKASDSSLNDREYDLEFGTNANTFYALDTYDLCPRAYLTKYMARMPLSISFYAQANQAARETFIAYAKGIVGKETIRSYFEARFDELAVGPYPIHVKNKDWRNDYRRDIGEYFSNFVPWWEDAGWHVEAADYPVVFKVADTQYHGRIDIVLCNSNGERALIVNDINDIYIDKSGAVNQEEDQSIIKILKTRSYLYGSGYEHTDKITTLFFNFYRRNQESKRPYVVTFKWTEAELGEASSWAEDRQRDIQISRELKRWPVFEYSHHFCQQRCVHGRSCRYAGWHPELVARFCEEDEVVSVPIEFKGVNIKLREDLDPEESLYGKNDEVKKDYSSFKMPIKNMQVRKIGDLRGKTVFDLAAVRGCGKSKIAKIIDTFFTRI